MSEQRAEYKIEGTKTLTWFKDQNFSLEFSDPEYIHPTFQDVRELRNFAGWSQSKMASIVGVSYRPGKGATAIRKWCSDPSVSKEARKIPYASWRLLLITAGIVKQKVI
ncbi:MAG: hypothetical protein QM478_11580 [Flavobacteriaceae bacterium]